MHLCSLVCASTGKDVWPRLEQSHLTWGGWHGVLYKAAYSSGYVYVCVFMWKHWERVFSATPGPADALAEDSTFYTSGVHQSISQKAKQVQRSRHVCGPLCVKLRAGFIFRHHGAHQGESYCCAFSVMSATRRRRMMATPLLRSWVLQHKEQPQVNTPCWGCHLLSGPQSRTLPSFCVIRYPSVKIPKGLTSE